MRVVPVRLGGGITAACVKVCRFTSLTHGAVTSEFSVARRSFEWGATYNFAKLMVLKIDIDSKK